ncbi:MAG: NADH-quinone oxidoreductase subunit C [Actinobacteria bacterium]|nr:NADH-quinone oxidoreductase subunit C [Actinomycetota bacterium]
MSGPEQTPPEQGPPEQGPPEQTPPEPTPPEQAPQEQAPPEQIPKAGAEETQGSEAPQGPKPPAAAAGPVEADGNLPARLGEERLNAPVVREGLFGVQGTPDTSGYGLLRVHRAPVLDSPRPYGSYFDEVADTLGTSLEAAGVGFSDAIEHVVADRGELTLHVRRDRLPEVAARLRDDPALRFEICGGVSGVHYPDDAGHELHAVYHLLSITHNRRLRLEVTAPDADPHIPTLCGVYPACNWHERETWDFFGIIFDGHPGLTRIEMPDDWKGHPQRKDYPLGGIPVEYRGARIPAPDERRHYS